ncbi:Uncultured bacterium genome assembly Metasoil_fosmids_resub OS=uncultured bacterium PE=4 SV=1 [Gemmata massiliana]|uniref:Uncharacterized protein n=1 Tax=Gemmata massiliana TaxID=1210884 RepID=A0A6P2D8Z6_9BACT|nr:hypothetical protein [Gemmata massiliana]VTR97821.1 Uncultured bacterium genome assembly Metasoil_fosmids_resub OS=uncultured bacterium PE=4 SV=1 [Gemmata massiliana]
MADGDSNAKPTPKPRRGRSDADETVITLLAGGATIREAAAISGVSERTITRRLKEPAFRQRVSEVRAELMAIAAARLAGGMSEAVDVLRDQLKSADPHVRHKSAVKLIELTLKVQEVTELRQKLEELERRLEGVKS